jgi:hypothetical protein
LGSYRVSLRNLQVRSRPRRTRAASQKATDFAAGIKHNDEA